MVTNLSLVVGSAVILLVGFSLFLVVMYHSLALSWHLLSGTAQDLQLGPLKFGSLGKKMLLHAGLVLIFVGGSLLAVLSSK